MTNNTIWKWVLGTIIGLSITALAAINTLGVFQGETKTQVSHNHEAILEIKPEIKKNSDHRIKFEEKVTNMGEKIDLIYKEVTK